MRVIIRQFINIFPNILTISPNNWTNMLTTERKQCFKTCQKRLTILPNILTTNCTLTHPHLCHLDNLGHRHKPRPETSLLMIVNPNIKARYLNVSNITSIDCGSNYQIFSAHLVNAIVLVPATELIAGANLHNRWLSHKAHPIGQLS